MMTGAISVGVFMSASSRDDWNLLELVGSFSIDLQIGFALAKSHVVSSARFVGS